MNSTFWSKKRTGPRADLAFLILGCLSGSVMAWVFRRDAALFVSLFLLAAFNLVEVFRFVRAKKSGLAIDQWVEGTPKG